MLGVVALYSCRPAERPPTERQARSPATPAATAPRPTVGPRPWLPVRLEGSCQGESCGYGYRVVGCAELVLRAGDSLGAPVRGSVNAGDTATVVTGNLRVVDPGIVLLRRDYLLTSDFNGDEFVPRADTIAFRAGDTVFVLAYAGLAGWSWWYNGARSGGTEFWDGPAQRFFTPNDDSLPGHSLSTPLTETWLRLRPSKGTEGWWLWVDGRVALIDNGDRCQS